MSETTVIVDVTCMMCKQTKTLALPAYGYAAYKSGVLIQRAMPTVPACDRELLISQTCGPCFDKLFDEDGGF